MTVLINSNRIHVVSFAIVNSKLLNIRVSVKGAGVNTVEGDANNIRGWQLHDDTCWTGYTWVLRSMTILRYTVLASTESRRAQLTEQFFRCSVLCEVSCLHYLLPEKCDSVTDHLHHAKTLNCSQPELLNFETLFSPTAWDITISQSPVLYC